MRIFTFLFLLILSGFALAQEAKLDTLWQNSAAETTLPAWFSPTGNTERGFAANNSFVYVVSRNGGTFVKVVDAATGADVKDLDVTGVSGGTFPLNDAEVSDDGVIFGANLTTNSSTSAFKVYSWADNDAAPVNIISYTDPAAVRLGDKFTVTGSVSDNSVAIYAASASGDTVYKWTTMDNGSTYDLTKIGYATPTASSPSVGPVADGSTFYVNANGTTAQEFDATTGNALGEISGAILGTGSNAIRAWTDGMSKWVFSFQYGTDKENGRLVDVSAGNDMAVSVVETPSLGANSNPNGAGDVSFIDNGDGTYNMYVMSTNNGFGAYQLSFTQPPNDTLNLVWEKSAAAESLPAWFSPWWVAAIINKKGFGRFRSLLVF